MAIEYGFTIQPIVIDGHSALPSGSKYFNPRASFNMRFLDSIDPKKFDSMTSLRDFARKQLVDAHKNLK